MYVNLVLFSSQVLTQLNVFADDDIDVAAEALNDVIYTFSPFWHIPQDFFFLSFFFFSKKCLSFTLALFLLKRINENDPQLDCLNQLLKSFLGKYHNFMTWEIFYFVLNPFFFFVGVECFCF